MKKDTGKSLYILLGTIIAVTVLAVLGSHAAYTYLSDRQRMLEAMEQSSALSIATLKHNIAGLMEAYAVNEYDNLVATEIRLREHFAIIVHDYNMGRILARDAYVSGKIRNDTGEILDFDPDSPEQRRGLNGAFSSDTAEILSPGGAKLGTVSIYVTDEKMNRELNAVLSHNIVNTILIALLLIALLLLAARRFLVRPLSRIAAILEHTDSDGIPSAPVPAFEYREISILTDTINAMFAVIRESRASLQQEHDALQQALRLNRSIIETIPDLLWLKDVDGVYIMCNPHFERFRGARERDIVGKSDYDFVDRERAEFFRHHDRNAMKAGKPMVNEEWITFAVDGTRALLETTKTPVLDRDGKVIGVLGIGHDITLRVEAEEQLRKLSRAVEQSHNTIFITDLDARIEFVNPAFTRTTGYSSEEAIGQNPSILQSGEHDQAFYQALWDTLDRGEVWQGEFHNKRKDNSLYWELTTISPVVDEQGETTSYVAVKEDITERKRSEIELREANLAAEAASRAKSAFLANMSHELRTPLHSLLGFAQILQRDDTLGTAQQRGVDIIHSSGNHLLTLINDILDLAKIEAGRMELRNVEFGLKNLLDELQDLFLPSADEKGLQLSTEMPPELPSILLGDPVRLRQVLFNLIGNAIKFTQEGSVTVKVTCKPAEDLQQVGFYITDTGIGISPEQQQRLFQPFTQADDSINRQFGGTGLGLSISRRLVELMGGEIGYKTDLGKGSCFHFTLNLKRLETGRFNAVEEQFPAIDQALDQLRGAHVLIVEDNDLNRELIMELLGNHGIRTTPAWHGKEALEVLQHESCDGVLMDIQMPIMDGFAATRAIRAQPRLHQLPIIALTADVMPGDLEKAAEAGMNAHIGKPIEMEKLLLVMARWITPTQNSSEETRTREAAPNASGENDKPT